MIFWHASILPSDYDDKFRDFWSDVLEKSLAIVCLPLEPWHPMSAEKCI